MTAEVAGGGNRHLRCEVVVDPELIPRDENARLEALRRYDILDTPPDGSFDRITALAARLLHVPIAIVGIVDTDRIWFKSYHGLDFGEIPLDAGPGASAVLQDAPWVINDALGDPRALTNPLVAGEFGLRFYAGVPLKVAGGHNLGTLSVLDFSPREVSAEDMGALEDLAGIVVSELELRLASRRAASDAREREVLNDALMGMLSHELRAPATVIYAGTQLLAGDASLLGNPRVRDLIPDMASESERLLRLLDDLLVLTRVEQGGLQADREPVLVQRLLARVVESERRRWPGRTIQLRAPDDLPPVSGDEGYVEQVAANLLSNALKYSSPHEPLEITALAIGDEVEVRFRDRGIGLPTTGREAVFGLLFRTDAAKKQAPGLGIGLYVCHRLLEAMGGRIWAEDAPEVGTVFAFRLPVVAE